MGFLKRAFDFISRPTQSRTMGILIFFVLLAAVSLTVIVSQQQQNLRQRAAERLSVPSDQCRPPYEGLMGCLPIKVCTDSSLISSNVSCTDGAGKEGVWCYKSTKKNANCSIVKDNATIPGVCDDSGNCFTISAPKTNADSCEPSDCSYPCKGGAVCKPLNRVCMCQKDAATPTPTSPITSTPPSLTCESVTNCSGCINAFIPDNLSGCGWEGLPNATGNFCHPIGTTTACPSGTTHWYVASCSPKSNHCLSPTTTTPTTAPTPQPPISANCPISEDATCGGDTPPAPNCKGLWYPERTPISNCPKSLPKCWKCLSPTPTPTPSATCNNSNSTVDNDCFKKHGIFCAVGSSCKQNPNSTIKDCSCQSDTVPTPTSSLLSVTLAMAINAQDTPLTDNNISVTLSLYNLSTNTLISGAPASQAFARTPIPKRQYAANISLTNLAPNKYFIVARRDNMIAKSVFTITSENLNITVPTTTLVFGDINNDNDINALDYQLLRPCYKKAITANASCLASDFDKNEVINQIDLNTLLRGWATWNKEGKEL